MENHGGSFAARYGRWALVAGGSEGLGADLARQIAARGLDVILVARRREPLEALAQQMARQSSAKVLVRPVDLADRAALQGLLAEVRELEIGLVVCNAALSPVGDFLAQTPETHERVLAVSCQAPSLLVRQLAPKMVERGRGGIVLVSSMAGMQGGALVAHYAATKAYLRVLAEGLWYELRPRGVDVLATCPGPIDTPTFRKEQPTMPSWLSLPPMDSAVVASETLAALGRGPVVVPGARATLAAWVSQRLLPRTAAISVVAAATKAMYRNRDKNN